MAGNTCDKKPNTMVNYIIIIDLLLGLTNYDRLTCKLSLTPHPLLACASASAPTERSGHL